MTGRWYMVQDQTLNFEAFVGDVPDEPARPSARFMGIGADLTPTEDARALQRRLAAEVAVLRPQAVPGSTSKPE